MKSGTYKYKHNHFGDEVIVQCDKHGNVRLYDAVGSNGGIVTLNYKGVIEEAKLMADYTLVGNGKDVSTFDVKYYINGKLISTPVKNVSFGIAWASQCKLLRTTHKAGNLCIERFKHQIVWKNSSIPVIS